MKKTSMLFLLFCLTLAPQVFAQHAIGVGYGIASSSSDAGAFDGIDGSTLLVTYGRRLSSNFVFEVLGRKTSFDTATTTIDLTSLGAGSMSVSSEIDVLTIGTGFRFLFWRFFNAHAGIGYSKIEYNAKVTGSSIMAPSTADDSGFATYYGAGLQLPVAGISLFADYTIHNFSSEVSSNELVGGLRFGF